MAKNKKKRKKKQQKLNTRMIAIISASALAFVLVVGGLVYYQYGARTSRNIRAGDQYVAEGKFNQARKFYGRVLYRQPDNAEVLEKLIDTYSNIIPLTVEEAREFYGEKQIALVQRAKNTGVQENNYLEMAADLYESARLTNRDMFWGRLQNLAEEMTNTGRFPRDSEAYAMGRLYQGVCMLRLRDGDMTKDIDIDGRINFPGEVELLEHIALRPDSDEGHANLAFGRLSVARKLGLEGRFGQEQKNLVIAQEAFDEAIRRSPDGPAVALMVLRHQLIQKLIQNSALQNDSASVSQEEVAELEAKLQQSLDHAEAIIARDPAADQTKLIELLTFMPQVDRKNGNARSIKLLDAYLAEDGTNDRIRMLRARSARAIGDLDSAAENAMLVVNGEQKSVSLASIEQFAQRAGASSLLFDIAYERWSTADIDEKDAAFVKVVEARERLADLLGGNDEIPIALNADARIAMGQERYREAAKLFERQIFLDGSPSPDTLRAAAFCLEQTGQTGLALERITQAIAADPMGLRHYLAKAKLEGRMSRPGDGIVTLESLPLGLQTDNEEIAKLMDSLRMLDRDEETTSDINDPILRLVREADQLIRSDRAVEARSLLNNAMDSDGTADYRVLGALAQTNAILGNYDEANKQIDKALLLEPDSELLLAIKVICRQTGPVERVRLEVDSQELEESLAQATLYVSYMTLASQMEMRAKRQDRERMGDAADETRAIAAEALAEAAKLEGTVDGFSISEYPVLFDFRFQEAIDASDWDRAAEMVELSASENIDDAAGNLSEAKLLQARADTLGDEGDADAARALRLEAAAAARRATEISGWSDMNWVMLGMLLDDLGNTEEAMEAYEEAYRRNPSRQVTIIRYARRLLDPVSGEPLRALRMLREAKDLYPNSTAINEVWLAAESESGDTATVLSSRMSKYKSEPGNRVNAMRLAAQLASIEPSREYFGTLFDTKSYTPRQWNALSGEVRQDKLNSQRARIDSFVKELMVGIESSKDESMAEAMAHASIYIELKNPDTAIAVVRNYIDGASGNDDYVLEVLSAAQFFIDSDRMMEAAELLASTRDRQSAENREIDYSLGMMHFMAGTNRRAVPHFRSVLEVRDSEVVRSRLAIALIRLQRFQEAEQEIALMQQASGQMTYGLYILAATMEEQKAEAASAIGDQAGFQAARKKFLAALEQANLLEPLELSPYVSLVDTLLGDYSISRDPVLLDQAISVVQRGIDRIPDSEVLVAKRADVLEAQGELNAAIMDLEQMSRKYPSSTAIRERLIVAYLKSDQIDKAQSAIMDGIALMPDEGTWYESLGDYYVSITDPDLSLATEAYLNAYRREPSRALLFKINRVTRTKSEWDYDAMISLFKDSQFRLEDDPITIGLFARSLAGKGAYERASTQLRNEYKAYSDQIKDGTAPEAIITRWYEDLFVVFAQQDGESGETLALELSGSNPDFWNKSGLAQYWSLRGSPTDFVRAVELQRGVVELAREKSPEQLPLALSRLGNYLISNGEAEESLEVFREMLDLQPDNAQALNNYAYILAVNIGKPQEAIEYARQAVLLSPKSPETIDTMATIHEMLGSHEEALSSRLRLYQLNPTDLATILYIADAYDSHMDDPGKSLQFAELAMKIKPEDPRVLDAMGWASYRTGRALEGEDLIRQSIRSKPSARSHVHMAQVFMQKGDLNKAGEQLGLAEDLSPDDETKAEIERLKDDIARS